MKIMKNIFLLACFYFGNSYSNELVKLVDNLNFRELKDIILSKKYSKEDLPACKAAIENIIKQKSKTTAWYKNFSFLSRVALGSASTIYFTNMFVKTITKAISLDDPSGFEIFTCFFKFYTALGIPQMLLIPIFHNFLPDDVLSSSLGMFGGLGTFFKGLGSLRLIQDKDYNKALAIKSILKIG